MRSQALGGALIAALLSAASPVWAQTATGQTSGQPPREPTLPGAPAGQNNPTPGPATPTPVPEGQGFWERSNLLGDPGGVRARLANVGVSLGLTETDEILGNPTGGRATGVIYEGLTELSLGVDLGKAIGLEGGIVNISAFQIHGRGLSTNNIANLQTASSLEADRSTRLFEWWYQQSFLGGKLDVKLGQQSADLEFITTQYGGLFINSGFGFPTLAAIDLPSGGPAYPLATPAIRLRAQPFDGITALLAVFNGSPSGLGAGDPQYSRNTSGTNFDLDSGVYVIGEVDYARATGTYKLGAWYNSNAFTNQFVTGAPTPAAPQTQAVPSARRGDWSIYTVVDQSLWAPEGAAQGAGLGSFLRVMGAPGKRNLVDVFIDGGLTYKGVFGRDNDTVGIGFGWTHISSTAQAQDRAIGSPYPVRSAEGLVEITYQSQLAPWWLLQPDLQVITSPGGGIPNPSRPGKTIGTALVLGARSTVTF